MSEWADDKNKILKKYIGKKIKSVEINDECIDLFFKIEFDSGEFIVIETDFINNIRVGNRYDSY